MEKLTLCRICLVDNVRMYAVVDKNMHKLYKMLTDITFVTDDRRPMLACFYCYAKLKQCYQLQRKCLEAEQLFDLMMNEPNSVIKRGQLEFFNGYIKTPIENINIVDDVGQIESIAVKQEIPDVCERLDDDDDDFIQRQEEHQGEELDHEFPDILNVNMPLYNSELEDDVPLMETNTGMEEEQEVFKNRRKANKTIRTTVAKKPKTDIRRMNLEDKITGQQRKTEKPHSKNTIPSVNSNINNTPVEINWRNISNKDTDSNNINGYLRLCTKVKPYKCKICQRSFAVKSYLTDHIRVHTGEKPYKCDICQHSYSTKGVLTRHNRIHTGEKPYKCDICHRSFKLKIELTCHIRVHTAEKPFKM